MEGTRSEKIPFFSIVMPTYGVEEYIDKAIKSIQNQTYTNWEIIVVDDATPDKSTEIVMEYVRKDARIQVIHHRENKGLSETRNTGLAKASGQYIWFMDPDDYVDSDVLEKVYNSLQKNPAELVVVGLVEEYFDKNRLLSYTHTICPKERYYAEQETMRRDIVYLEQQTLYGYAWNKFYQLDYLKKIGLKYESVKLIEDIVFNIKFCMDIRAMNVLPITPYHYGKRMEGNLTNKFVPEYYKLHRKRIHMLYEQYQYWGMCTEEVKKILGSLYARYILSALQRNCEKQALMTFRLRRVWCEKLFKETLFQELMPYADAMDSKSLSIAIKAFRMQSPQLCLIMGRIIYTARIFLPMIFSKVKSRR